MSSFEHGPKGLQKERERWRNAMSPLRYRNHETTRKREGKEEEDEEEGVGEERRNKEKEGAEEERRNEKRIVEYLWKVQLKAGQRRR